MVSLEDIKLPPHNIEAEKWLLSTILLDNDLMYDSLLQPDCFYQREHQHIYRAMKTLHDQKRIIDVVTVSDELKRTQKLEEIGWDMYLYEISCSIMTTSVFKEYHNIVLDKYKYRAILWNCQKIMTECYSEGDMNSILKSVQSSVDVAEEAQTFTPFIETMLNVLDTLGTTETTLCDYWYPEFDDVFHWYKKGQLIVIGARPWVGKSAMALNMALQIVKQGKRTVYFSLEMPKEDLAERVISKWVQMPSYSFKYINDEQKEDISKAVIAEMWEKFDIEIYDHLYAFNDIMQKIRITKAKEWLDVVFIDYLTLMRWKETGNRNYDVGAMTTELKRAASELWIAIVLCCQLNRQLEMRIGKKPELHDLRDSGSIEQDANIVIMPYRDPDDTTMDWMVEILVRKNRNGPTCDFPMWFELKHMDMFSLEGKTPKKISRPLPTGILKKKKDDEMF